MILILNESTEGPNLHIPFPLSRPAQTHVVSTRMKYKTVIPNSQVEGFTFWLLGVESKMQLVCSETSNVGRKTHAFFGRSFSS